MAITSLLITALASSASAARLYGASYDGTVRTFDLKTEGNASLTAAHASTDCGLQPSWLEIDKQNLQKPILYCVNEAFAGPNSSLSTYNINTDGSLSAPIANQSAILGAVASIFYGSGDKQAIALAHFASAAWSTFSRTTDGKLQPLQNQTFTLEKNGTGLMQDQSRPHQAVLDPKGQFLVFPDYGADLVRIFTIDSKTSLLTQKDSIKANPASAPRHAVFWSPDNNKTIYLFVVHELGNIITSHKVTYGQDGPSFEKVGPDYSTFGANASNPEFAHAAEITVANGFLVASNRNHTQFQLDNPDPTNSTKIPSDSIITYKLKDDGTLDFVQLAPSGGTFPRHFSINKAGDLVAVANQNTEAFVVWSRCTETGVLKDRVATFEKAGSANQIIWDE